MLLADHNAASVCLSVSLSLFEAVNNTNTGTVSKATLGKFWETGWSAWLWAFPNALIPSSTALIWTKLAEVFTYDILTRTHFAFNNYAHILCLFTDKVWEWEGGGYDTRLTASVLKQDPNAQMFQKDPNSNWTVLYCSFEISVPFNRLCHSSGAVWESRWTSWAVRPNEPSGFRGRKDLLHRASALVTTCP